MNDGDVDSDLHDSVPSNRRAEDTVRLAGLNYHHLVRISYEGTSKN